MFAMRTSTLLLMLLLVVAGCSSKPPAPQCPPIPAPAAWMMEAPSSLQTLDNLISPTESK